MCCRSSVRWPAGQRGPWAAGEPALRRPFFFVAACPGSLQLHRTVPGLPQVRSMPLQAPQGIATRCLGVPAELPARPNQCWVPPATSSCSATHACAMPPPSRFALEAAVCAATVAVLAAALQRAWLPSGLLRDGWDPAEHAGERWAAPGLPALPAAIRRRPPPAAAHPWFQTLCRPPGGPAGLCAAGACSHHGGACIRRRRRCVSGASQATCMLRCVRRSQPPPQPTPPPAPVPSPIRPALPPAASGLQRPGPGGAGAALRAGRPRSQAAAGSWRRQRRRHHRAPPAALEHSSVGGCAGSGCLALPPPAVVSSGTGLRRSRRVCNDQRQRGSEPAGRSWRRLRPRPRPAVPPARRLHRRRGPGGGASGGAGVRQRAAAAAGAGRRECWRACSDALPPLCRTTHGRQPGCRCAPLPAAAGAPARERTASDAQHAQQRQQQSSSPGGGGPGGGTGVRRRTGAAGAVGRPPGAVHPPPPPAVCLVGGRSGGGAAAHAVGQRQRPRAQHLG